MLLQHHHLAWHLLLLLLVLLVSQSPRSLALSSDVNVGSVGGSTVNNGELHTHTYIYNQIIHNYIKLLLLSPNERICDSIFLCCATSRNAY